MATTICEKSLLHENPESLESVKMKTMQTILEKDNQSIQQVKRASKTTPKGEKHDDIIPNTFTAAIQEGSRSSSSESGTDSVDESSIQYGSSSKGNKESNYHLTIQKTTKPMAKGGTVHFQNQTPRTSRTMAKSKKLIYDSPSEEETNKSFFTAFTMRGGGGGGGSQAKYKMRDSTRRPMMKVSTAFDPESLMIYRKESPKKRRKKPGMRMQSLRNKDSFDSLSLNSEESQAEFNKEITMIAELDKDEQQQKFEQIRKRFTIPTSSYLYQLWKLILIILSFVSSFQYAYYATFMHTINSSGRETFQAMDNAYSIIFLADMVIHILTDEHHETEGEWTLKRSCLKQIQGNLFFDMIAVIPFADIFSGVFDQDLVNLLYFLKIVRLWHGFKLLNYKQYKKQLKDAQFERIQRLIHHSKLAEDQTNDHARMSTIMLISQILKTVRLIIILLCLSYFTGLLWFVNSRLIRLRAARRADSIDPTKYQFDQANFIDEYSMIENSNADNIISVMYFTFTTLATVGLGDFHPKGSSERILCTLIMLFGVSMTSMLMDNLSMMIKELRNFDKPYDESGELNLFIRTLTRFNGNMPMSERINLELDEYFLYRWKMDKNMAIKDDDDQQLLSELPRRVRAQIYVDFLFKSFMETYKSFLDIHYNQIGLRRKKLLIQFPDATSEVAAKMDGSKFFNSNTYEDLVIGLLTCLEPILFHEGQIIQKEGQAEMNEVLFLMSGEVEAGYNKRKFIRRQSIRIMEDTQNKDAGEKLKGRIVQNFMKRLETQMQNTGMATFSTFPVTIRPGQVVGFFEILFHQKSQFVYKVKSNHEKPMVDCLFIRSLNLRKMLAQVSEDNKKDQARVVIGEFKLNVLWNYINNIYLPVLDSQKKEIDDEQARIDEMNRKKQMKNSLIMLLLGKKPPGQIVHQRTEEEDRLLDVHSIDDIVERVSDQTLKRHHKIRNRMNYLMMCLRQHERSEMEQMKEDFDKIGAKLSDHGDILGNFLDKFQALLSGMSQMKIERDHYMNEFDKKQQELDEERAHFQREKEMFEFEKEKFITERQALKDINRKARENHAEQLHLEKEKGWRKLQDEEQRFLVLERKLKVCIQELDRLRMYVNNKTLTEKKIKGMDTMKVKLTQREKKKKPKGPGQKTLKQNELDLLNALQEQFGVKINIPASKMPPVNTQVTFESKKRKKRGGHESSPEHSLINKMESPLRSGGLNSRSSKERAISKTPFESKFKVPIEDSDGQSVDSSLMTPQMSVKKINYSPSSVSPQTLRSVQMTKKGDKLEIKQDSTPPTKKKIPSLKNIGKGGSFRSRQALEQKQKTFRKEQEEKKEGHRQRPKTKKSQFLHDTEQSDLLEEEETAKKEIEIEHVHSPGTQSRTLGMQSFTLRVNDPREVDSPSLSSSPELSPVVLSTKNEATASLKKMETKMIKNRIIHYDKTSSAESIDHQIKEHFPEEDPNSQEPSSSSSSEGEESEQEETIMEELSHFDRDNSYNRDGFNPAVMSVAEDLQSIQEEILDSRSRLMDSSSSSYERKTRRRQTRGKNQPRKEKSKFEKQFEDDDNSSISEQIMEHTSSKSKISKK